MEVTRGRMEKKEDKRGNEREGKAGWRSENRGEERGSWDSWDTRGMQANQNGS